jgi:predicted MFS family arabinose efflux permease
MPALTGARLVAVVCAAQVLVQIGAYFWPALMPSLIPLWGLSNSEAGWVTAIFYGAYLVCVPVLVTLTDRIDAKRVYLFGVACTVAAHVVFGLYADGFWTALATRALAGMGWAGTYMTGLKLLADRVDARLMSRAVSGHAAGIGVSGALSYACAGLLAEGFGWRAAFVIVGLSAAIAWITVAAAVPGRARPAGAATAPLFDFRPVLRNRSAMAYSIGYCIHTLEMNALRGWGVVFLGFVAANVGMEQPPFSPIAVLTALGLLGTVATVLGNETAIRFGRRALISFAMLASVSAAAAIGFVGTWSYSVAAGLLLFYGFIIWLDSSALTAGSAGSADPARRGATLAVHSMLGYAGGFVGPLMIGVILDMSGGMSVAAWRSAFLAVAGLMLLALIAFVAMRPRELSGDKGGAP